MKRYAVLIAVLALFFAAAVHAKPVSKAEALNIARNFFHHGRKAVASMQLKSVPLDGFGQEDTVNQPFYIFNAGGRNGFVMVAGDDEAPAILGYAATGDFVLEDAPQSLKEWMKVYALYIRSLDGRRTNKTDIKDAGNVIVEPLLKEIAWGQDHPFNEKCPAYTSGGKTVHYYTGCVAAAATQIMKYYNYPDKGTGSHTYTYKGLTLSADFGATTYDWNEMADRYAGEGEPDDKPAGAVATLASHFGIAVEMQYEQAASGAYTMMVPRAFKEFFGYDPGVRMYMRNYYNSAEWMALIKSELDAGRPVYYGGSSDQGAGGHAFVCDGYDSNDYVHINWGWYGNSNGYFMVNHLDPGSLGIGGGGGSYNLHQEIVIGIRPENGEPMDTEHPLYCSTRLSVSQFEGKLNMMSYVQNMDTDPFAGVLGALLVKDRQVVEVVEETELILEGFANGKPDTKLMSMPGVELSCSGVEDGEYELRWGIKQAGTEKWQLLRHYTGSPDHAVITVEDGVAGFKGLYIPQPDVTLLEKLSANGELYAKGIALFHLHLRNNSRDVRLKNLLIHFESESDPSVTGSCEASVSVYEQATEKLDVVVGLDEALPPGKYKVTLSEKDYPGVVFDDTEVGRAEVEIHPEATTPVLRLEQSVEWRNEQEASGIKQGDNLVLALAARNYGLSGKVDVITYLQDTDHPEKTFVFKQAAVNAEKGKSFIATFYRKLPVDPGTYRVEARFLYAGQEYPVEAGDSHDCIIPVSQNEDLLLNVVSFDFPGEVVKGRKYTGSITFEAPGTDYDGTVYLRIRQFTNTNGEIIYMGKNTIPAGEQRTISFHYTPAVDPGTYLILVEARKGSSEEGTVGNYENCYKIVTVSGESLVDNPENEGGIRVYPVLVDDVLYIEASGRIDSVEIVDANGRRAGFRTGATRVIPMGNLSPGVYFLKIKTSDGYAVRKIMKK